MSAARVLPSGRKKYENTMVYKAAGKGTTLPRHIKKGFAHPLYNATVEKLLKAVAKKQNVKE